MKGKNLIIENYNYTKIIIQSICTKQKKKTIFLDVSETVLSRYLYNLIKFFKLNDYTVFLPKNKSLINKLCRKNGEFKYASFILNGDLKLGNPKKIGNNILIITKEQLSIDYFNENYSNEHLYYHVPMSQYPLMYDNLNIEENISILFKRKRTVFMAGNFSPKIYNEIKENVFFNILSRRDIVDFIYGQNYYHQLTSFENLNNYILGNLDFKVILIDTTNDFYIKLNKLKEVLREFDFFLALPGITIPQSHNLIEAMAMGCIPIIHKTYANLFYPKLQHYQTAILYETTQELDDLIKEVFVFNENEVILLRENVLKYYKKYLSPKAVVDSIITNNYSKILIQAESFSLSLLKN